jgi:hypothetical protein
MTLESREFDCKDCGLHIYSIVDDKSKPMERCATCQWIQDQNCTPEERKKLREFLNKK